MTQVVIQQDWVDFACRLADVARAMLLAEHDSHTTATLKPDRSFVTALDLYEILIFLFQVIF